MKIAIYSWLALGAFLFVQAFMGIPVVAEENSPQVDELVQTDGSVAVSVFGRDDCGFCKQLFAFLDKENIPFDYLNITEDDTAADLFTAITEKHSVSKVTPITVIGETVIVGFNGERTTGRQIIYAIANAENSDIRTLNDHLDRAAVQELSLGAGCTGLACDEGDTGDFIFDLPFLGVVDFKTFSLFSLSLILGVIDGFNPCAMWVLVTFLALLAQAGSKRKMVFLAGLFILAQGIMYNLILNVWYKTWDFVKLDEIVTPLVGFIAIGGGTFFLYRWYKNRNVALVCDISSIDTQMKTVNRFKEVVNRPVTIASVLAILVIAFSVNIIEFACSIGIPQAYTKILELNMLTFMERQWYIFVYTLGYMFDDVVVFALAIWGFSRLEAHGQKYAQHSLLIGGALMLALGLLLVLNPQLLVW
ncbi:MAG: glutaredoxin domain-containing protein [Candidatus Paceibacteria bacterium]